MRSTNWRHPLVDGLAVLVGILAAFAIQAGWDLRQERNTILGHLESLAAELSASEAGFRNHVEFLESQDRTIRDILAVAIDPAPSSRQLDSLVWTLGPFVSFEPSLPALRALDVAGLGAIESEEVRTAIIRFENVLARDLDEQNSFSEYWRNEISPYWDGLFNIRDWIDLAGSQAEGDPSADWLLPELMAGDLPRPSVAVAAAEILSDRRFLNQMSRRVIRSWRIRSRHALVMDEATVLRELLLDASS